MKILHVGNGNLKHCAARYYDVGRKLTNGFIRNGHDVYFLSDRDTARAGNLLRSRKLGVKRANKNFVASCHNYRPDMIVFGLADIIQGDAIRAVREFLPQVKIAQFHVDPVFRPKTVASLEAKLPWADATFITSGGPALRRFSRPHGKVSFMPNPVDASIDYPRCHERSDQPNDVFWATRALSGGTYPGNPRTELAMFLEKSGRVAMDYHGMNGKAELFGDAYYRTISRSRMGLNISVDRVDGNSPRAGAEELYLYSSDRIAQYMGSGLLTLTNRDNGLEDLFKEDQEIVLFSSPEELLDKVLHYKQNDDERRRVAAAGWRKVHEQFNSQRVAQYIVDVTFRQGLSHDYTWPTELY